MRIASTDITVEEMNMTVGEFFRCQEPAPTPVEVALEHDLRDLFARPRKGRLDPVSPLGRRGRPFDPRVELGEAPCRSQDAREKLAHLGH